TPLLFPPLEVGKKGGSTTSDDIAVVEVSSFQLESTVTFRPKISVILNISPDHLDRHKSMENYVSIKKKIFANQTAEDYTVLNVNHPIVREFAQETKAKPIFFSSNQNRIFRSVARNLLVENFVGVFTRNGEIVSNSFASLKDKFGNEFTSICKIDEIQLPGKHNLENALAAVAVGSVLGVMPDSIRRAILNFTGIEHAFEFVKEINGVKFINDTKATDVEATRVALETASKPILLIMGGYDKGNDYSPLIELVKNKVKGLLLLGQNTARIEESLGRHTQNWHCKTMDDAVKLAYSQSSHGDTVLLSPANASFDLFEDYRNRGNQFKEAVKRIENTAK
ncbi:MAG: UDP-N-acetylmuramoyl-L-alanine--D-glutamate ligase, partial [bacterium]